MKVEYEQGYEILKEMGTRKADANKVCMFVDEKVTITEEITFEVHWHEWIEIIHLIEGAVTVGSIKGELRIEKGETVVFGSQTLHELRYAAGTHHIQCLHINVGFIMQYASLNGLYKSIYTIENQELFMNYFQEVIRYINNKEVIPKLKYHGNLLLLVSLLIEESKSSIKEYEGTQFSDIFGSILVYINRSYHEALSLHIVAEKFGITPQYVSHLFKKYLKITFLNYVTQIRVDKAKFMLHNTKHKIIDIAYECGFSSEHSFINSFKRVTGVTPLVYRKRGKCNGQDTV